MPKVTVLKPIVADGKYYRKNSTANLSDKLIKSLGDNVTKGDAPKEEKEESTGGENDGQKVDTSGTDRDPNKK